MLDKNNTTFKEDIEASFKKEVAAQLQMHNDTMMETTNQSFTSFQSVMLQTIKYIVIQMVLQPLTILQCSWLFIKEIFLVKTFMI